ncbi:dynamin family protein [Pseudohongiella sp.]|uniref:Dynamin N-terminal domain-containing protein n=1 Tax=marine sediment metagenome TaxID=412755 RepID=A0A0F9VGX5_9ZZZZ|nr:dynamin family protein [Pseudohongiella sp.]HDZ08939.1 hypothetical protein [Pseudohongiella sp.]HEA63983.1 hypothetical protein [Pseudohongiella sp.]
MKTNMQAFCQELSKELEPFGEELRQALSELPPRKDFTKIDAHVRGLQEVQQRLSTLREKVSKQSTFLLIFGPLKSGKSTLMNALSGAYVSEVSSLPAYPALVYVKNGDQRRFEATDYEGDKREFPDNVAMAEAIQQDHAHLADAIVAAENTGEAFDPQKHYPQAIRRMDIEVPAASLAESGSVLVDTPGLYSRMRFGYDQMTRDFRDTATCAIFVVKTDNLFFEKVFEEFEELLNCFSRIFLVANIDSSKQDLSPDGTLTPSLESLDPDKIIDSFRSLSMSATLSGAIENGQLKIYPIDLQKAATRMLGKSTDSVSDVAADDTAMAGHRNDGFDEFVDDLTSYLNSSDYFHDFKHDSVRLARDLSEEAGELVTGDAVTQLRQDSREELERERERLAALQNLEQQNWEHAFNTLQNSKGGLLEELTEHNAEQLEKSCQEQLSAWMDSDESWNALLARLNPEIERESRRQSELLLEHLKKQLKGEHAGAEFTESQLAALRDAGLQVEKALAGCLQDLGTGTPAVVAQLEVKAEDIPITRTLGDYLKLRSRTRVWQRVFGDDGSQSVEAAVKKERLGNDSLEKLHAIARDAVNRQMPELLQRYADELTDAHVSRCVAALEQEIAKLKAAAEESVAPLESTMQFCVRAQEVFDRIKASSTRFSHELNELQSQLDLEQAAADEAGVDARVEETAAEY